MDVTGHLTAALDGAIALANSFGPPYAYGRPLPPPDPRGDQDAIRAAVSLTTADPPTLSRSDDEMLAQVGRACWAALDDAARGHHERAAAALNDLLGAHRAQPRLVQHDRGPWHLHFSAADVTAGQRLAGDLIVAVAVLSGSDTLTRLRSCSAARCDRLFLDTTRSRTRRYCSTTCQNRTKVAAFRSRTTPDTT